MQLLQQNITLWIFWNSDHRHTSIFIKAVVFNHVGLSWMILNKDQYEFSVEQKFIEWCTGVPWFHNTICHNLHGPIFEELFFTARQDMYVLMCGLHAYDKENYQSTGATNFGGGRPIPDDSTTITPSFTQIAPWRGRRLRQLGQAEPATMYKCSRQRPRNRRATFLSGTSGNRGQTVFTTYVSWTLTSRRTGQRTQRSASTRRNGGEIRCIWRISSSSVGTSPPLLPRWTGFWGWRWKIPWKG